MKIVYLCFVSNGFDDHFKTLVCSSMSEKEFLAGVAREYLKASSSHQDAVSPYFLAVNLDTLQAKPIGFFKLEKDGKIYAQVGRGQYSGKAVDPDDLKERTELSFNF
jgi:hypothetical protein